jgi:hypothetical protein
MEILKMIFTTKTGRYALGGIITAVGAFMADKIGIQELIAAVFVAIQTINLRHGIEKK